jgi:hypothetical protein
MKRMQLKRRVELTQLHPPFFLFWIQELVAEHDPVTEHNAIGLHHAIT